MARLIDGDALKELYEMGDELKDYEKVLSVPIPVIQQNIKDMPTIDAVPVVRCKDCKYRSYDYDCVGNHLCEKRGNRYYCEDNDFCSYGERRSDEDL